jgi:hypothetical protein
VGPRAKKLGITDIYQFDWTVMAIPNTYRTALLFITVKKCDLAVPNETKLFRDCDIMELTRVI